MASHKTKHLSADQSRRLELLIDQHVGAQVALATAAGRAIISQREIEAMVAASKLQRYLKALGERTHNPEKEAS